MQDNKYTSTIKDAEEGKLRTVQAQLKDELGSGCICTMIIMMNQENNLV
eukprot:CAMPEP_0179707324 /NCGR_PEP_ID=MMETSP0937-20121108/4800_1 /TAXON_ID=548131 ORGANISM="Ostreococcus mediterraneus, Strain clade-D-RCC2593" /NCGR_SAMPLE_ID=MMETSP0937 /ASSEMBLY_ACC=CAM_ASM_000575 /LENGTH=48 /DNA_ID= /DNA_START= /DNA_END= /DNA_ORIENTATION=